MKILAIIGGSSVIIGAFWLFLIITFPWAKQRIFRNDKKDEKKP